MGVSTGYMGTNESRATGGAMEGNWRKTPDRILEASLQATMKAYGGDEQENGIKKSRGEKLIIIPQK